MDTQKKNKKLNSIIWTCAIILIFLFLLTTLVVVMRIGDFIPNEWNVIFLVPKEPSFVMSDGQNVWETDTEIELFRSEYKNDKGDIVVVETKHGLTSAMLVVIIVIASVIPLSVAVVGIVICLKRKYL